MLEGRVCDESTKFHSPSPRESTVCLADVHERVWILRRITGRLPVASRGRYALRALVSTHLVTLRTSAREVYVLGLRCLEPRSTVRVQSTASSSCCCRRSESRRDKDLDLTNALFYAPPAVMSWASHGVSHLGCTSCSSSSPTRSDQLSSSFPETGQ